MKNKWLFLRWALTVAITLVGFFIVGKLGGFEAAWKLDATKITFLILLIFVIVTGYCGSLSWKLTSVLESGRKEDLERIEIKLEHGWFTVSLCEALGYLGTIIGLIMVFTSFEALSSYDAASIKKLISQIYPGFQTAFITTAAGLVCSNLLKLQCHNIYMGIKDQSNE